MEKCTFGPGVSVKPDGVHELDPCVYRTVQVIYNVTVHVNKCKKCGHVEISWERQPNSIEEGKAHV